MKKQTCENCFNYHQIGDGQKGECRRFPPVYIYEVQTRCSPITTFMSKKLVVKTEYQRVPWDMPVCGEYRR